MARNGQLELVWPYPSGLPSGSDWSFLHRIFGDLSKKLTWPFVEGIKATSTATNIDPIIFPTITHDASSLYNTSTNSIHTPQGQGGYSQWLACGGAAATITTPAGTSRSNLIWRKNNLLNTLWAQTEYSDQATIRLAVPIFEPMNKGDFLTLTCANTGAATLTAAKFVLVFIPLG